MEDIGELLSPSSVSSMKESMRSLFEKVERFGIKWEDLEDRLAAREGAVDEKMRALGLREKEVAARERLAGEKFKAAEAKEDEVEAFVHRRYEELTVFCVDLEMKNQEQDSRLYSITSLISERGEELTNLEMKLDERKRELAALDQKAEDLSNEVRSKERKLLSLDDSSAQYGKKVQSSKDELASLQKTLGRICKDLELKEREYGAMRIKVKNCDVELETKTKELEILQSLVVDWEGEVNFREDRCHEVDRSVAECSKELFLKRVQLNVVQESLQECFENLASRQAELDAIKSRRDEFDRDIEARLADYHSLMALCEKRSEMLETKEKRLEEQLMEFKSQQEQLTEQRRVESVDGFDMHCALKDATDLQFFVCKFLERHDFVLRKVLHVLESSPDPAMLVLETIKLFEHDNSVKSSGKREYTVGMSKRCCLLLLSVLNDVSKSIADQVRESGSMLASQWKALLKPSSPNYTLEAMVLLRLLMVFELNSALCPNELKDFLKSLSKQDQADGPQGALRLPGEQPSSGNSVHTCWCWIKIDRTKTFSSHEPERDNTDSLKPEYNLDPGKTVLDAIEGSYRHHLRNGKLFFETGIVGNHIFLLEQLMSTSAVIAPEVKESALKFANAWGMDLQTKTADSLEVLAFIHLLAAYNLGPNFNEFEILKLIQTYSLVDKASELCHILGYSDPDTHLQSGLKKRSSLHRPKGEDHTQPKPVLKRTRVEKEWMCSV